MTKLYQREGAYIPRVAAVHDMCGYGKCSLGVAIPVLSAAGVDVCPVPTALFSAHTKFPVFHMHDTTDMLEAYLDAWREENVELDGRGIRASLALAAAGRRHPAPVPRVPERPAHRRPRHGRRWREVPHLHRRVVARPWPRSSTVPDVLTPNLTEAYILTGLPYEGQDVTIESCRKTPAPYSTWAPRPSSSRASCTRASPHPQLHRERSRRRRRGGGLQ